MSLEPVFTIYLLTQSLQNFKVMYSFPYLEPKAFAKHQK